MTLLRFIVLIGLPSFESIAPALFPMDAVVRFARDQG